MKIYSENEVVVQSITLGTPDEFCFANGGCACSVAIFVESNATLTAGYIHIRAGGKCNLIFVKTDIHKQGKYSYKAGE